MLAWVRIPPSPPSGKYVFQSEVSTTMQEMVTHFHGSKTDKCFLVTEEGGVIVGLMGFRRPSARMEPFALTDMPAELINAYVKDSSYREKGIGRDLITRLEEIAREGKYKEIILNSGIRYERTGHGFYDRMGYKRVGEIPNMYGPTTAQVWRKPL